MVHETVYFCGVKTKNSSIGCTIYEKLNSSIGQNNSIGWKHLEKSIVV